MTAVPVTIPASYQTNRVDLNAAIGALVDAFMLSVDYSIGRKYWSELPDTLTGEAPMIVLGDIAEEVKHDMQLRITTFTGTLWYIDWMTDRQEYNDRVNVWADHMRDLFTYNPSIVNASGELRQTGFSEGELTQGSLIFGAPQLSFVFTIQEGYR